MLTTSRRVLISQAVMGTTTLVAIERNFSMSANDNPLTMWSPDAETERGLQRFIEQLVASTEACWAEMAERTALKCCENSRYVSDVVESLLYTQSTIDAGLLSKAIAAITKAVEAVSQVGQLPQIPSDVRAHVEKMTSAMTGRRDDLLILQTNGRMAFFQRA